MGRVVWLVIHGLDIYETIQDALNQRNISYDIVSHPIEVDDLKQPRSSQSLLDTNSVKLILADLIPESHRSTERTVTGQTIAMFVLDRSEQIKNDDRIEQFCKNIPFHVELGYFLALEDPLVQRVLDPMALIVLEQLGLDQHDLITSNMITSRLNRLLRRESWKSAVGE